MPRFPYALLGALALHGLVLSLRVHSSVDASVLIAQQQPAAQALEFEEFPVEEAALEPPSPAEPLVARAEPSLPSAPADHAPALASKSSSVQVEASSEAAPIVDAPPTPLAASSSEVADARPARKIDLGLDGHFFLHAPGPESPAGPETPAGPAPPTPETELGPRARKSTTQRQLEAALSANDVARGLARGNALQGSLYSAARAEGPVRGEAIFQATIAADGSLGSVALVRGTAAEWSAVISAFRRLAANKHVRLPPGAKGLRVTFSVKAKVQRPSGKETTDTAVRVANPSLAPNGLLPNGDFDLADLGGGSQRLVYARVVAEEVL